MRRSERDLRDGLKDTLSRRHPAAPEAAISQRVDEFLASSDWDDDLPEIWKQRWRDDREAERTER